MKEIICMSAMYLIYKDDYSYCQSGDAYFLYELYDISKEVELTM